ncbi:MAG: ABC transporter permease [Coriobacteriia bacterium]|nr:ABC transporter permease [Coriobacteriia bacterium]
MKSFAGFWEYVRFILARERIVSPLWIVSLAGSAALFASMYPGLFTSADALTGMAQTMDSPAMVALMGPVYGLDSLSIAMSMAQQCLIWFAVAIVVMNIFFVNRYTRADEELGRFEMLRALPMGRLTNVVATLLCALLLNVLISGLTMLGLLVVNLEGTTIMGSLTYSFALGGIGFFFAALTVLLAQLLPTSRGVLACSFAIFGAFYILRAWGDLQANVASYFSPIGVGIKVAAFYDNNLWPLAVLFCAGIFLTILACAVYIKRDLGEGVIPAQPGRRNASVLLKSPFGLAWRLSRNAVLAWAPTALVAGAVYGSVVGEINNMVADNPLLQQMVEGSSAGTSLVGSYIAMLFSIMAILGAVPVVNAVLKIRSEEKRKRIEQVYATATSRTTLFAGYILIALLQSLLFMLLSTLGFYAAGASTGLLVLSDLLQASLVYLPALWLMLGFSVALVGLLPRLTTLIWALFAYSFMIVYFGRMFTDQLPSLAFILSPFGNVPQLPVETLSATPLVVLTVLSLVLVAVGLAAYRQRDLQ